MEITLIRRTKSIAEDPAAGQRKRDRESGRLKAQEHAPEMLMMIVGIARNSNEETKNRLAAAKYVCDRAWGTPKAEQNEDPAITNKTMLDILEQISLTHSTVEQSERKKALEAPPVHPAMPQLEGKRADYALVDEPFAAEYPEHMQEVVDYELIEATDDRTDGV